MITWMFGFYRCDQHKSVAVRDCNAYCHREKIVSMVDARVALTELFRNLEAIPFKVRRTSGALEEDWILNDGYNTHPEFISKDSDGIWRIPVINPEGLTKTTPIADLTTDEIAGRAIEILERGIYLEDAKAANLLLSDRGEFEEIDGIVCGHAFIPNTPH